MAGGLLKAPGSPGINGVKSCILVISWQQNWPFRNYNLIQKITGQKILKLIVRVRIYHKPYIYLDKKIVYLKTGILRIFFWTFIVVKWTIVIHEEMLI
jgi:hypothetical protein